MFRFFSKKKITPNLLKFYFYSLKQGWFSSVNQDNMTIESCVIGHMTYCYIKIYSKIGCRYATYRAVHNSFLSHYIMASSWLALCQHLVILTYQHSVGALTNTCSSVISYTVVLPLFKPSFMISPLF